MTNQLIRALAIVTILSVGSLCCYNTTNSINFSPIKNHIASDASLTIDFCTYFGGAEYDGLYDVVRDDEGNVFVVGESYSTNFPLLNAFDSTIEEEEVVVAGFNSEGGLIFSTFFGGSDDDYPNGMCLGDDGLIYVVGATRSPDLLVNDTIQDELQNPSGEYPQNTDGFILVIDKSGERIFSTYLGGNNSDSIYDIDVAFDGTMNIVGYTRSDDLPVTDDARDNETNGQEAFYGRLTTGEIEYLSYLGGTGNDVAREIETSSSLVYIAGETSSEDFPLVDPYSDAILGDDAIFVSILHETGAIMWSTYFGGSLDDTLEGMEIDTEGNVYLTGDTNSVDFPVENAFDDTLNGTLDVFLSKIIPSNSTLAYSTFIGGTHAEEARNLVVDGNNKAILTGYTLPPSNYNYDFPSVNEFSDTLMNQHTPFLCRFTSNGSNLEFSTKFGTLSSDFGYGIATAADGSKVVIVGTSQGSNTSTWLLPTVNAFQPLPSTQEYQSEGFLVVFSFAEDTQTTTSTSSTTTGSTTTTTTGSTTTSTTGSTPGANHIDSTILMIGAGSIILIIVVFMLVKRK